jgi:predicted RNase H-like nuclease (RuvC/YqgF family)
MEQQSSQAFKLADQLREKQREVAKLQEQLKNTSGAASAAPKADNGAEVTALKRRIAELEDASSRTSADAKKAQTELSNIKRQRTKNRNLAFLSCLVLIF